MACALLYGRAEDGRAPHAPTSLIRLVPGSGGFGWPGHAWMRGGVVFHGQLRYMQYGTHDSMHDTPQVEQLLEICIPAASRSDNSPDRWDSYKNKIDKYVLEFYVLKKIRFGFNKN